jgi:4-hydroxybenzoate polyprenyltransferase
MSKLKKVELELDLILDAGNYNWVDQFCPLWAKPYLKLSRLDRPVGTWLLLLPCWWGSGMAILSKSSLPELNDYWIIISCVLGAILMRGAGCTWNDISDQKFDAQVKRTKLRPLPSGQISTQKAFVWMLIQCFLSFLILLTFNSFAVIVGLLSTIPVLIYPFAKRFTWWPQLFLGVAFNWGVLLSFSAHTGRIDWGALVLYGSAIFWTLFYDTIYAFQDAKDDAIIGLKSTALLFGSKSALWLTVVMIISCILMQISFYISSGNLQTYQLVLMMVGGGLFFCHLLRQLSKLDAKDTKRCLIIFQSNKNAGLILVASSILAILAPSFL